MSKSKTEKLESVVLQMAQRLMDGEENLPIQQLASNLRESGIEPETLKQRFHEAARRIADRERAAGRPAPIFLEQAIEATLPGDEMPSDRRAAQTKFNRLLGKFTAPFELPADLQAARAYRKSGDLDEKEQQDLDRLEQDLKQRVREEHEGDA